MKPFAAICFIIVLCSACDLTGDIHTSKLEGYDFSLYEVQRYCSVTRLGDKYLTVNCTLAKLKPVTQYCEGEIYGGLADVDFQCKAAGLWMLTDYCNIKMHGVSDGSLKCRIYHLALMAARPLTRVAYS